MMMHGGENICVNGLDLGRAGEGEFGGMKEWWMNGMNFGRQVGWRDRAWEQVRNFKSHGGYGG